MSARVTNSADQTASNVALAPVAFDTTNWDTGSPTPFLDSGYRFIAPITGKYFVIAQAVIFTSAPVTSYTFIGIVKRSDNLQVAYQNLVGTVDNEQVSQTMLMSTFVSLTLGQSVEFDIVTQSFNGVTPVTTTIAGNTGGPSPTQSSPVFQISLIEPG